MRACVFPSCSDCYCLVSFCYAFCFVEMSVKSKKEEGYFQTFKDEYARKYTCITSSKLSEKSAYCQVCRCDFSISHSGARDIVRHLETSKHIKNVKRDNSSKKLDTFLKDDNRNEVITAELLFTSFLVEHNIPLAVADHAGPLFRKMFPKCEVAKQYGCARTKTAALVSEMALSKVEEIVECMKNGPFAAACDGSNDSDFNLYPIVVTYFNTSECRIQSSLFSIPNLTGNSTGENISQLIISEFEKHGISIKNLIAFMADNAAVMQGKKIGVVSFLKKQHTNLIAMGCACHLINLASEKGASALPIAIDEILVDIYYYLQKSAKRKQRLQHIQNLHNKEARKILKHCSTRWLSLGRSLLRLVEQWDPLLSFFKDTVKSKTSKISLSLSTYIIPKKPVIEKEITTEAKAECSSNKLSKKTVAIKRKCEIEDFQKSSKKPRIAKESNVSVSDDKNMLNREEKLFMFLSSEENKAYCLFLLNTLPVFDTVNATLQSGQPYIHKLRAIYLGMLKELYCRFLKPSVLKNKDLTHVDYHAEENRKELSDIVIGHKTVAVIEQLSEDQQKTFYENVLNFYTVSCDYIINKFPLNEEILKNAEVADLAKLEFTKFSNVKYFIDLFPCILKAVTETNECETIDELEKQFCSLQVEDISAILQTHERIDAQWVEIGNFSTNGIFKYKKLSQVMLSILLIPHSNAECERIFSIIKKNRNEVRSSMSNKSLENLLILKTSTNNMRPCYEQTFSPDFLKKAKKATCAALK